DLALLSAAQRQQMLLTWNATQTFYPPHDSLQALLQSQVQQTPDRIALVCEQEQLSYAQLYQRAGHVAHLLHERGIGPDEVAGVCMERPAELVVALLAILLAGGAYLPLDPSYPADRLAFMLQDSRVSLLLTQHALQDRLPVTERPTLELDLALQA